MNASIDVGSFHLHYCIPAVAAVLIIFYISIHLIGKIRILILGSKLPGPRAWPIIGNVIEFTKHDLDVLDKIWKYNQEYGLARIWLGPQLNVFICTAEDAEIYYSSPALLDRSEHIEFLKPFAGNGLLTASGPHWKKAKKLMEPAFRYSALKSFVPIFQKKADILVRVLEKEVKKATFSVYDYIKNCTFDIVTRAMCDMELNAQVETVKILEDADALFMYSTCRMYSVWQRTDFLYKFTEIGKDYFQRLMSYKKYADEMIALKKKDIKEKKETFKGKREEDLKNISFVQRLIEQEEWNDDELRDHITTMVATGYETSACQICFILVLLGIHKDVQENLYQEIFTSLQNGFHDDELAKLEYLDKVIKESMRIFPIVPLVLRKATEDVRFGKYLVPKGAAVGINIFAIHRNPKYYENPDKFNPENFSKEQEAKRHPFAFVPFSMRLRKCTGEKFAWMVIRIIITKVLFNYKIECDLKLEEIVTRVYVTLKMKNGFPIRLLKRQTVA